MREVCAGRRDGQLRACMPLLTPSCDALATGSMDWGCCEKHRSRYAASGGGASRGVPRVVRESGGARAAEQGVAVMGARWEVIQTARGRHAQGQAFAHVVFTAPCWVAAGTGLPHLTGRFPPVASIGLPLHISLLFPTLDLQRSRALQAPRNPPPHAAHAPGPRSLARQRQGVRSAGEAARRPSTPARACPGAGGGAAPAQPAAAPGAGDGAAGCNQH